MASGIGEIRGGYQSGSFLRAGQNACDFNSTIRRCLLSYANIYNHVEKTLSHLPLALSSISLFFSLFFLYVYIYIYYIYIAETASLHVTGVQSLEQAFVHFSSLFLGIS